MSLQLAHFAVSIQDGTQRIEILSVVLETPLCVLPPNLALIALLLDSGTILLIQSCLVLRRCAPSTPQSNVTITLSRYAPVTRIEREKIRFSCASPPRRVSPPHVLRA